MIKILKLCLISLILFNFSFADELSSLDQLLQSPNTHTGMMVMNADSGKILYQYQANQYFPPASISKLFTAIAALKSLGANYQFKTTLNIVPNSIQNHTINGNLYVKFSGDPSLSVDNLQSLFEQLNQQGIDQINGNIVLVNTVFTANLHALGVTYDDSMWGFGAAADSIMLNENSFDVFLNDQTSQPSIAKVIPSYFKVDTDLVWLNDANKNICTFQVKSNNNQFKLNGCIPHNISVLNLAITNPEAYAETVVTDEIKASGIELDGKVTTGILSANATQIIAKHSSASLNILIVHMLKQSDNLYAVALSKTMGIKKYDIGSDKAGVAATMDYLAPYALPQYFLENGSGTSRYNLVNPTVMALLLYNAHHDQYVSPYLMPALPIAGIDGTLQNFPSSLLKNKIYAKTGTMDHVANLSGYLISKHGQLLAFSLLLDDTPLSDKELRQLQANILNQIYLLY